MRRFVVGPAVCGVILSLGSASQRENTLSSAYDKAFGNPKAFEWFLLEQDSSFYENFADCARAAIPVLRRMEATSQDEHRKCKENSECAKIAKEIDVIREVKEKVGLLADYIAAVRRDNAPAFRESEAGKRAFDSFEVWKRVTGLSDDDEAAAALRRQEPFNRVIRTLETIPCK